MSARKGKFKRFLSMMLVSIMTLPFGVSALTACGSTDNGVDEPPPSEPDPIIPDDPDDPTVPDEQPERYVRVGDIRIGLISDTVVRVEYRGAKGFEDRDTFYISNRDAVKVPSYTVGVVGDQTVIATSDYKVYVPNAASSLSGVRIESATGAELWRYLGDTTSNVYLPSPSDELTAWQLNDNPRIVPSEHGYSNKTGNTAMLQGWDFNNQASDCYVFLPQGDYKRFCEDYVQLTGKSELISLQMLGYWDSRWYAYSDKTAMQQIDDYISKGYSIDILVIDKDWHANNGMDGVGYEVDTNLFPNMSGFLDECHKKGINIMFNDHPEPVKGTGNLLDGEEVEYRNDSLTMILSLGLDYWWYDRNWGVSLNSIDPDISVYAAGMYAFQFVTDEYLHNNINDMNEYAERALIMGNVDGCLHGRWTYASDTSAHKYTIQWTGDIATDTTALSQEIYASVFGGAEVGLPYMSSDIGGHTAAVSDDMYVRWLQYGALSTICRVHCTALDLIGQDGRMPWLFGDTAEKVAHEYVDMRYRLLPLFYALARENYDTGLPIMRRTDIEYPEYVEAARNDQYMLGKNLLVAPIAEGEVHDAVPSSWLSTSDGKRGLDATYFDGTSLGKAKFKQVDSAIDFNWGVGGPRGMGSDNFSVRWEGYITIGDADSKLMLYADDGIRMWIDDVKVIDGWDVYDRLIATEQYYAAGSKHKIKVEYFEGGGNAHCYMYYSERNTDGTYKPNTRTVFLPEGTWIDVWSGARYAGPQTVTVSHGLETSPIFVREGGVFALAENMVNTSEKDWSKMSLDIYAGTESTETTLYEDDVPTQAYKDGKFRKTLITNEYDDGKFTVTVNPAEGEFSGSRAFTERTWTVRIHYRPEWGRVKSVKVNGRQISKDYRTYKKSNAASPFAFSGASRDSNVFEFTVTAGVYDKTSIVFELTDEITSLDRPEYDDSSAEFTLTNEDAGEMLDLSQDVIADWAYFGADEVTGETVRKNTDTRYIGDLTTYATTTILDFTALYVSWTDGEGDSDRQSAVTTGLVSQKDFALTFKTDSQKRYYVINLGGENCIAKLTVKDRAGNAKTIEFGNLNGSFGYRAVIEAKSEKATEITATYSVLVSRRNGLASPSYVNIGSVYVATALPEIVTTDSAAVTATATVENNPSSVNLSVSTVADLTVADWRQFDSTLQAGYTSKNGGTALGKTVFTQSQDFGDYTTAFGWTDGDTTPSCSGTTHGLCSVNGTISVFVNATAKTRKVLLYVGAFNATGTVKVYNSKNELIASSASFSATEPAATRLVTVNISAETDSMIIIKVESSESDGGNVSIAAVQVLETA